VRVDSFNGSKGKQGEQIAPENFERNELSYCKEMNVHEEHCVCIIRNNFPKVGESRRMCESVKVIIMGLV